MRADSRSNFVKDAISVARSGFVMCAKIERFQGLKTVIASSTLFKEEMLQKQIFLAEKVIEDDSSFRRRNFIEIIKITHMARNFSTIPEMKSQAGAGKPSDF